MTEIEPQRGPLGLADRLLPESVLAKDPGERMRQRLLVSFGVLLVAFTVPWYLAMFALDPAFRIPRMTALGVIALVAGAPLWLRVASTRVVALAQSQAGGARPGSRLRVDPGCPICRGRRARYRRRVGGSGGGSDRSL